MLLNAIALVPVAIWTYLLVGRGGFWRIGKRAASAYTEGGQAPPTAEALKPEVVVVVPARDEAATIGDTINSLLRQTLAPKQIIVVDDDSTDGTGSIARNAAEVDGGSQVLTVVAGSALRSGWTGKLWALQQGTDAAMRLHPDFILLTDADIHHAPTNIQTLVAIAELGQFDLASFMVRLSCQTTAEKALIPAFIFFFFLLYPPAWIESERYRTAGAAGGCVLIRPEALQRAGGLEAIQSEVIDDCALARIVKRSGGRVWLGVTDDTYSTRTYSGWGEVGNMISRTAFNQLGHSGLVLAATTLGLTATYVLPAALLFRRSVYARACGGAALLMMTICYGPFVRFYGRPLPWALTLPGAAVFYMAATGNSALRFWRGRGGTWKGRVQDA